MRTPVHRLGSKGFTMIELMIVITIITTIASITIPNLLASRIVANETAAIAAMKALVSAQSALQAGGRIDVDENGRGEYGCLGEMTGLTPLRGTNGLLAPAALSSTFGFINGSQVVRKGFVFQVFLPGPGGVGVAEDPTGGFANAAAVEARFAESFWCAYAWPSARQGTGNRAFFVNQQGEVIETKNVVNLYGGVGNGPAPDAAFGTPGSILGEFVVMAPANDGEIWTPIGK